MTSRERVELAGYELHGGNTPSRAVSGDYFAAGPIEDGLPPDELADDRTLLMARRLPV